MKKKLVLLLLTLLTITSTSYAQGISLNGIALYNSSLVARIAPSALITVCAANDVNIPCTSTSGITLYSNYTLSSPLSNPFNADANGNYNVYLAPGNYTITVTGAGLTGYSYPWTSVSSGSLSSILALYLASPSPIGASVPNSGSFTTLTSNSVKTSALISGGNAFLSGCTFSNQVGGSFAGTFVSGTNGTCTMAITPGISAPHDWFCFGTDLTHAATLLMTMTSATGCSIAGTTTSSDMISWFAVAF